MEPQALLPVDTLLAVVVEVEVDFLDPVVLVVVDREVLEIQLVEVQEQLTPVEVVVVHPMVD
jgi:hypothetical protein